MGQVSSVLRRAVGGYLHWCPGCQEIHLLPDSWNFDRNIECPTFHPSFKHQGLQRVFVDGNWTGEWKRDAVGKHDFGLTSVTILCTPGNWRFGADCTHAFARRRKTVVLPPVCTDGLRDEETT